MVRAANNPPASFKMKDTQMLLSSNCTAILLVFPKRPMKADFSRGLATEQMRTKWGNQANPGRRATNRGPKDRAEESWLAVKLNSSLHDKSHTELFRHAPCECAFHLACQPTAASSPPPFGLVGVNEQQALSNCLRLTRLTKCQRKKQMRRKQATPSKTRSQELHLRSELTRIWSGEAKWIFHPV